MPVAKSQVKAVRDALQERATSTAPPPKKSDRLMNVVRREPQR